MLGNNAQLHNCSRYSPYSMKFIGDPGFPAITLIFILDDGSFMSVQKKKSNNVEGMSVFIPNKSRFFGHLLKDVDLKNTGFQLCAHIAILLHSSVLNCLTLKLQMYRDTER